MTKQAWEIEQENRKAAIPLDRRVHSSNWEAQFDHVPCGDEIVRMFWKANVPGSGAPEIPYLEMAQALYTKGFDTRPIVPLIMEGIALSKTNDMNALRAKSAELMDALNNAKIDPHHKFHQFEHPDSWEEVRQAMEAGVSDERIEVDLGDLPERIYQGWLGQLAGGSFGTAIEGYTAEQTAKVYGEIRDYITQPETYNDDVTYELVFLDVFEKFGRKLSSRQIGLEWVKQVPFGWSAEWMALRNLNMGIFPPASGSFLNPFSNWIGGQMRGMVCGMVAPAWPMEAARLAHLDGVVSHDNNGVYGEIYAAVLTSLAFVIDEPRALLREAKRYIPQKSLYASVVERSLAVCSEHTDPAAAWKILDKEYEEYHWIDAHNNIAAVIYALWYGQSDMTESFSLLAKAGLDVDCNAGLVGNVLALNQTVPEPWAAPLGDLLETYLPGKERMSIRELANRTARLALL